MAQTPTESKRERVARKFAEAMKLSDEIKISFWGSTPLVSPRVAKILSDPETAEVFMRAVRAEREPSMAGG